MACLYSQYFPCKKSIGPFFDVEIFVRIAVKINNGDKMINPNMDTKRSMNRLIFFCQTGNCPLCTSINGMPDKLFVFNAPLIISTLSGVILIFTSLSLSFCKMRVSKLRSFLSTVIITSSIFIRCQ